MVEDLDMIDMDNLKNIIKSRLPILKIIPQMLDVNMNTKKVHIYGYKINDITYIITKNEGGTEFVVPYTCPDSQIVTGVEYLYHMIKNLE
jgi:hypothetical protein